MSRLPINRAFRPGLFKEVVGQEVIVTCLQQGAINGRLPQCCLFSGTRGSGKTTLARILAKTFNCLALTEHGEPCMSCRQCVMTAKGINVDIVEIDGASSRGIDEIRQILQQLPLQPMEARYKIFIVDEVHMLTMEAFNALLKTLEEPPSHVKFIFATTELHKVPVTVLSRCVRFPLRRIREEEIVIKLSKILEELQVEVDIEALRTIARVAQGSLRDAEVLLDQVLSYSQEGGITLAFVRQILGLSEEEALARVDSALLAEEAEPLVTLVDELFEKGVSPSYFLQELIEHYRQHLQKKTPAFLPRFW